MRPDRTVHRARAAVAALVAGAAGLGALPPPPAAAATPVIHVAGDFYGDSRAELFQYRPGNGLDLLYEDFRLVDGSVQSLGPYVLTVDEGAGTYLPYAGDFDGDGDDEVFFYGPGDTRDFIWNIIGPTERPETPKTQGGLYVPLIGDFNGNGIDDILWYAPGTVADQIWEFRAGPNFPHTVHALPDINATYRPVAGNFTADAGDEVLFYGQGSTVDYLWRFVPGTFTPVSTRLEPQLTGADHRPVTLDAYDDGWTDILFYNPGATIDPLWNFTPGIVRHDEQALGTYTMVTGDFFGDGYEDVFWFGASSSFWDWTGGQHPVARGFGVS